MVIPLLPLTLVGTAVAFYLGFKNNQAYDRVWEARKIWGAFVNSSRSFASMLMAFNHKKHSPEIIEKKKQIIKRHLAYLYTLREQLLIPAEWEHSEQFWQFGGINQRRKEVLENGFEEFYCAGKCQEKYLNSEDLENKSILKNYATYLNSVQAKDIDEMRSEGIFTEFQQRQIQVMLNSFYDEQAKAERIKKFPLPRQYANASFVLVAIFIILLPLGMVNEFNKLGNWGIWTSIPFCAIVGWVYLLMELVGDYSENPFEGLMFDTPTLSICRTIEIDLLQMINETEIPKPISARETVLM